MVAPTKISELTLKLTDSIPSIKLKINGAIAIHLNSLFLKKKGYIENQLRDLVGIWIRSQPEIQSLAMSGNLAGQFGLPAGTALGAAHRIVTSVQQSTQVTMKKINQKLEGGLTISCQPSSFANLLGMPDGHVKTLDGDLHWLRWLLESGSKILVVNYHYTPSSGFGRSKIGVMEKGGAWRVPPEFSGTLEDNFITRAFVNKEKDLNALFGRLLKG